MSGTAEYRVLARKYRPASFAELIGHETLVRTLGNAFSSGRIAHAFMLTGVRGIGKTTTARLIARALNCTGADGTGGPTISPCGQCDACRSIAESRHPDVIETDAASRTGVDDMRELIETVRYRPVSARYKVYIIDEVHMLSKGAFNALLKTLEEPPPDIKFVFATTEIQKVPVTVLSRCQRYTLPRIAAETLAQYFGEIAAKEDVEIEPGALALIARAADGSVRDGLSILDQAMALALGAAITEASVRAMLGVADRGLTYDLFEALMAGNAAQALAQMETFYDGGTDPAMVLQDLLDVTHLVTRLKLDSGTREGPGALGDGHDARRAQSFAQRLGIGALTRIWQILLKGLSEVQMAPQPLKAAEMVLVRLVYVSDLPPPADIIKSLQNGQAASAPRPNGSAGGSPAGPPRPVAIAGGGIVVARVAETTPVERPVPATFAALMGLIEEAREVILYGHLLAFVHLVRFERGIIEFRPAEGAPRDLAAKLGRFLHDATGMRWMISVSGEAGAPTLRQQAEERQRQEWAVATSHPLVQAALAAFPGARIERITAHAPEADAPPAVEPVDVDVPALYDDDDPGPFALEAADHESLGDER